MGRRMGCAEGLFSNPGEVMRRRFLLLMALALTGCSLGTGPEDEERLLGFIRGVISAEVQITAPTTVRAGEQFEVAVRTYGLNSCWSMGETEVSAAGASATVSPFDIPGRPTQNTGCHTAIVEFNHTASIRFDTPGTGTVIVRGRDLVQDRTVRIERAVAVAGESPRMRGRSN